MINQRTAIVTFITINKLIQHRNVYFGSYIIVNIDQPATFSTADAMFVLRNQVAAAEEFLGEPVYVGHRHSAIHVGRNMASGDVWSVLEECVKTINGNTAQPANFLRQVFVFCMFVVKCY